MSKFGEDSRKAERRKDVKRIARDRLAAYFFDMSKLAFGGVVIGAGIAYLNDTSNRPLFWVFLFGIYLTCSLAYLAFKILKNNN